MSSLATPQGYCPACHQLAGQISAYSIDDSSWLPLLLKHMAMGGVIVIERTGTLLLMACPGGA